jgi:NAD-reducing hydrogenase large subunit
LVDPSRSRTIVIDPVTRIEGHAKITLHLDEAGQLADARFHVTEFRGFEKFCVGRSFREMPALTSRVCGICPVSHLIASSKTGDAILAVQIPPAATILRRVMNLAQILQSHALSFFHLSGPDLFLGFGGEATKRSIFGLIEQHPTIARAGIRIRQIGQTIIEKLGGRKIHSAWAVPGGVTTPLDSRTRDEILALLPETETLTIEFLDLFKRRLDSLSDEIDTFGEFPSLFLGLVDADGKLEHYDGTIRIVDRHRAIVADRLDPARYNEFLAEKVESWSYLKFPYYRELGYPAGIYRVGPLARLNVADSCGTPKADIEHREFRQRSAGSVTSSFHYHLARLIEMLYSVERMTQLLGDPRSIDNDVLANASPNRREGIGVSEAPRGTLFHHYRVDEHGVLAWVNLLIATGQNNLAMNQTIKQIARHYIGGSTLTDETLNRIEAGIRAFDPCLSCSTHALGQMPMLVQLFAYDGSLLAERRRSAESTYCPPRVSP